MGEKHSKEVHYPTWVEEEIAKQTDKKYPVEESQGNLCFTKLYDFAMKEILSLKCVHSLIIFFLFSSLL